MAGYQDQLIGPSQYRETLPVDAYTRVGMIKQQQYDQGVQKVQGYIDSIAGIEALMPEQKDYLNQRINQLQSQVSLVASSDFSNQQIVNSVGQLTGKIASDPIIQNTMYATSAYRSEQEKMKIAQDSGKSSPANEYVFHSGVANWLNSHDPLKSFDASYTPYVDFKGKMIKGLNQALGKPDEYLTEDPFKRNGDGTYQRDEHGQPVINYAMLQETYKGVSPERIQNIVESTLDDNDKQQIAIDGQYEYRGLGKEQLKTLTDSSYQQKFDQINSSIAGLQIERNKNVNDATHIAQVDKEIDRLNTMSKNAQTSYLSDLDHINQDPEGYKGALYNQNWLAKFSEGMSYSQHSLKYVENPFFMAAEKERENNIKYMEFQDNLKFRAADLALRQEGLELEKYKADLKSKFGGAKGKAGSALLGPDSIPESIPIGATPEQNVVDWNNETKAMMEDLDTQKMALLAKKSPELVVVTSPDGKNLHYEWNAQGKTPEQIKQMQTQGDAVIKSLQNGYETGDVDPETRSYFDKVIATNQEVADRQAAVRSVEDAADRQPGLDVKAIYKRLPGMNIVSASGTKYSLKGDELAAINKKLNFLGVRTDKGFGMTGLGLAKAFGAGKGSEYEDLVNKTLTSPQERFIYAIMAKGKEHRTAQEQQLADIMGDVNNVLISNKGVIDARNAYVSNALQNLTGVNEPVATILNQYKAEDKARVMDLAKGVYDQGLANKKKNLGQNYDASKVSTMFDKDHIGATSIELVDRGKGNFSLRYVNPAVTGTKNASPEINLTATQLNTIFGNELASNTFSSIQTAIGYSKLKGSWTTNVQGKGAETARFLNNGQLQDYKVKYDVEEMSGGGSGTGQYQIRLYIHDTKTGKDTTQVLDPGTVLAKDQVMAALVGLNDNTIKTILDKIKPNPTSPTTPTAP